MLDGKTQRTGYVAGAAEDIADRMFKSAVERMEESSSGAAAPERMKVDESSPSAAAPEQE